MSTHIFTTTVLSRVNNSTVLLLTLGIILLYYSGAKNGVIHLWTVSRKQEEEETSSSLEDPAVTNNIKVDYITMMSSSCCHGSPVTSLRFYEEQALLISGHENGSICVWDIQVS